MLVTLDITPKPGADERLIAEAAAARVWELDAVAGCELLAEPEATDARIAGAAVLRLAHSLYADEKHARGFKIMLDAAAACMHIGDLKRWHNRLERAVDALRHTVGYSHMTRAAVLAWLDDDPQRKETDK